MAVTVPGNVRGGGLGIEGKIDVLDGTTGKIEVIWAIPPRIGIITIQVKNISGSYQVYTTASTTDDVNAGNIDWFPVFAADQTADKQVPIHGAVSAVKVLRVSGSQRVAIRGQ